MLGYSKILMVENFKEIVRLGGKPIYSDTDSIAFVMSEAKYPQYKAKFVPPKKTFGGMELEGEYERLITVGPKKYAVLAHAKDDSKKERGICEGDYYSEYKANGIPANQNCDRDIVGIFESVLHNKATEEVGYFSIKGEINFELSHTTSATKRLRNICLKGKVDDTNTISWWDNEAEFAEYCMGLKSPCDKAVDNLTYNVRRIIDATPQPQYLSAKDISEQLPMRNARNLQVQAGNICEADLKHRVYGLATECGRTYVGYTTNMQKRLCQHNGELTGGANQTAGFEWAPKFQVRGFVNKSSALKFEWQAQKVIERGGVGDLQKAFEICLAMKKWQHLEII
jgi:predicted GIY-YIG superfamily endonuclease